MGRVLLIVGAAVCLWACVIWVRASVRQQKVISGLNESKVDLDLWRLANADFRRDVQMSLATGLSAVACLVVSSLDAPLWASVLIALLAMPSAATVFAQNSLSEIARIAAGRLEVEKKAREVLSQKELAPLQWAARLAPSKFADFDGIEVGQVYQAGSGAMAGDFYDVLRVDEHRIAAVIGDVTGHGIEPSITALQAKYLLRAFLLQFRDPGQALEELNKQMLVVDRGEEFISLIVMLFDSDANTLRYASAGHPAAFVWHKREVRPLGATGPLLILDPKGRYHSREVPWDTDDFCVLYTDGLAEARKGEAMFGEDGIAAMIRRDPTMSADVMGRALVESAREFSDGPLGDDVAVLVVRRT